MDTDYRIVVAIHDVAPHTMGGVRYLLEALDSMGARPRVLKVIPNADGRHDIRHDPAFLRMLTAEAAAGSEVLLHGYTHCVAGPWHGPWPTRVRARLFAGAAAEFLTLDSAAMRARLVAGRHILRESGFVSAGFCAPCWLAPLELPSLLRELGFTHYVRQMTLMDLRTGSRLLTPWLGYMGSGETQEHLVGLVGAACLATARLLPVVKVFLHPQGAMTSPACARTLDALAALVRVRTLVTYGDLLGP